MSQCARCDYTGDLTQHALDTGHPVCYVCNRRSLTIHERQTCATCIARTRADLADIETLHARLDPYLIESRFPANSGAEKTSGSQEDLLLGGDALAMVAPGGTGSPTSRRIVSTTRETEPIKYPEFGNHPAYVRGVVHSIAGREHVADELDYDPHSVSGLLAIHEDDWRHQLRHPAAGPPSVTSSVAYLTSQLDRMAQAYSEFDTFADDINKLRLRLKTAIGLSEQPVRGADCFDCGNPLVRRYRYKGDGLKPPFKETHGPGLEDHYTCERCDRVYTQAEYMLAVRSHHGDQPVGVWRPVAVAAWLVGRPFQTLHTWLRDPSIPIAAACLVRERRIVVWMPDVTELDRRTGRRQRKEAS